MYRPLNFLADTKMHLKENQNVVHRICPQGQPGGGPSQHYGQRGVFRVRQKKISQGSSIVRNYLGVWKTAFLAPLKALKIDTMPSKLVKILKMTKNGLKWSKIVHFGSFFYWLHLVSGHIGVVVTLGTTDTFQKASWFSLKGCGTRGNRENVSFQGSFLDTRRLDIRLYSMTMDSITGPIQRAVDQRLMLCCV